MKYLKIIGDVHGKYEKYLNTINDCRYSIQVGDMGYGYSHLDKIDPKKHKMLAGNHELYGKVLDLEHSLGDFGQSKLGKLNFWFMRGAFSVDKKLRLDREKKGLWPKTWFEEEQLSHNELTNAIDSFIESSPSTVITHTCPTRVAKKIGNPNFLKNMGFDPDTFTTDTQSALEVCLKYYQPDVWIFGHFHRSLAFYEGKTLFLCLNELESLDSDKNGYFEHCDIKGKLW